MDGLTSYYTAAAASAVRTLFVAGLPEDIKPREIVNLFRDFPGYQSSHLPTPTSSSQPFAFVVFVDQHSALVALHALNGMVFDLEKGSTLFIDLAKSNPRSKRLRADDKSGSEKRFKGSDVLSMGINSVHWFSVLNPSGGVPFLSREMHIILNAHNAHVLHAWALAGVGSIHVPGMSNSAYNTIGYTSTQSHNNFENRAVGNASGKLNAVQCPTLFVANLGPTCSEQELVQIFSRCRGFLKLKMQSTNGTPVAFIDFQDTACSTEALNHLHGTTLYSSPSSEGMRLEYAKSRMGLRSKKGR